ncbi:FtsW/RodA/SpoVE family cell cycle protein [Rhodobaculum claviforme]|uniref:Probable peptidoglycan glycosyltransferase FtsW n=1 Tax=Rhodobaculum claviforme TaxID=1549854 RepID=A0A934TMX0_9RHOB|nr:putative peptidoglycan glycosyltransferase FtsW [Rhodobaculum claviforme]MBK5927978.1 cell division protein FtsW [Rhodobaculum claviforme]
MTEMVHGAAPLRAGEAILPRWWRTVDRWTISCVLMLFGVGLLLCLAASPPLAARNGLPPFYYVERQAVFGALGLAAMFLTSMLSPGTLRRLGVLGFVGGLVALFLLPVLGTDFGKGAVRWFSLGFASVQPSEFLKPAFVVLVAWLLAAARTPNGPPGTLISLGFTVLVVGLLAIQPDFGQAALILFTWGVMYFVAGAPVVLMLGLGGAALGAGVVAYNSSAHFARRIDGFLAPELDPRTQLYFAANAIKEGGFWGVGVGEGQVKRSLPDAHTDFIIAVAAEEYGLVMVMFVLALFATITLRALARLMRERDAFIRLAGTGLVCMFAVQALINVGVSVRLLPAKGMTLPFVSYGGSSLLATGIAMGMILALTRTRPQGGIGDILLRRT